MTRHYIILFLLGALFMNCSGTRKAASKTQIAVHPGKALYTTHCVSCHNLETEEIGPRLGGVTSLLSEEVLTEFIKNPNAAIENGNKRAIALSKRYKMIMPPFDFLKDEEIKSILQYIDTESKARNIQPLVVDESAATQVQERLAAPVKTSGLRIELEDFATIPPSSDKMPRTRLANMRTDPAGKGIIYESDQRGLIYRIENGQPAVFFDIRKHIPDFVNEPGLGTGLGCFAFHPDYLQNGLIYITHTEMPKGKTADFEYSDQIKVALQWVVSEWKMGDVHAKILDGTRRELLRINVPGNVHGVQEIAFQPGLKKSDPDYGLLYIGIGDGSSTIDGHPELCHTLHSPLGTILRIDPLGNDSKNGNYGIPIDNPFVMYADARVFREIYAWGFRNPHRMSWYNRKLISAEVSESNFEEINVVQKGGDYGWNVREGSYGISYKDLKNVFKIAAPDTMEYIKPFALYDHFDGAAICGGYVYEGKLDALKNKYIFGDILTGRLFYINMDKNFSDPTVYELQIVQNGKETTLRDITNSKRVDARVEYDRQTREMYITTKPDGKIRRIKHAFVKPQI